ncbi:MAG: efflux RND transporter periplasmic adaptor subunit [Syntrophomonadaceae bacterium]
MKMNRLFPILLVLTLLTAAGYWVYVKYLIPPTQALQASGTIEATTVNVTAKTSGTIGSLNLEEGDLVKKDQLLIELSRHDLSAQRERDARAVAAAQANLNDLLSGSRSQEIKASAAAVNIARINRDKAQTDLQRVEQLAQAGAVSQGDLEAAQVNLELKQNQLDAAQAQLALLQEGTRPDRIKAAEAEVERARAILKATDAMLEDLSVKSPLDGTVLSRNYEEGEYAAAGSVLATVADLQNLSIKVYIPTDDLPQVKLGQTVHFTVSGSQTSFEGKVSHIASQGEFTPKSIQTKQERANVVFAVKIDVANPDAVLKPGMPADVVFDRS